MPGREHESKGERIVVCNREDCAHRGDLVPDVVAREACQSGGPWYWCLAGVLVMDRRIKFGNTCARYNQRKPTSGEGAT